MTDLPGVKEWIDTYAPGADIRYVTLPLMRNVDEAVPATLPDLKGGSVSESGSLWRQVKQKK